MHPEVVGVQSIIEQPEREGVVDSWVPLDPSGRDTGNADVSSLLTPATSISGLLVNISGEAVQMSTYQPETLVCHHRVTHYQVEDLVKVLHHQVEETPDDGFRVIFGSGKS